MNESELKKLYNEVQTAGFPLVMRGSFADAIGRSNEVPYHYELIRKSWTVRNDLSKELEAKFELHYENGLEFLYDELKKEPDLRIQVNIVYLAAQILNYKNNMPYYKKYCDTFLPYLILYTNISVKELRRKAIIVLGWIGREEQISLLIEKMISDPDQLCRTWAASSLMQMSFHGISPEFIKQQATPAFLQAITNESDPFACGVMIESIQTLYSKKWISGAAVNNLNLEKIEKAKKTAIRVLSKL